MFTKKMLPVLISLSLVILACSLTSNLVPPTTDGVPPTTPATETSRALPALRDIKPVLTNLGGQPCAESPDFTCVSVPVPLDHFNAANIETLNVVFAVLPATGERYGMFVQAYPGGPGGEGISTATTSWFADSILEHYDIVYYDQRGIGLSGELACPTAYAKDFLSYLTETNQAGVEGYDTPAEQEAKINSARSYAQECVTEMGFDPAKLAFYGTNQVAEDLDTFRQAIGDEKFMLYGVSYGTAVAETYAAAHPDHLSGLILDGTIDLTQTGDQGAISQEKAFNDVLVATLNACNADQACAADMGEDAVVAYDKLAKLISDTPLAYSFPLPSGQTITRTFTFNELEYTAAYQLYSLSDRMIFLRALAAAQHGSIVPMARLLDNSATLAPATGEYLGDSTFNDTMFLDVACTDESYFSGTQDERIAKSIEAGQASNGTVPRLDGSIYTGVSCAFWPSSPAEVVTTAPLKAEGVSTLVLNATLDPATPFQEGKSVYENLADGYHIYVEGGVHSIYGWGNSCPDDYVTNFLVDGTVPSQRETVCQWDPSVISPYVAIAASETSAYKDPLGIMIAIDDEIKYTPEYLYSSFEEDQTIGCPYGGTFTFGPSDAGEALTFTSCGFLKDFSMAGSGSYDYNTGVIKLEVQVSGAKDGTLTYTHNVSEDTYTLTGTYGGQDINLSQ